MDIPETQNVKVDIVNTSFIKDIVSRSKNYLAAGFPVHFIGPTGVGKTTLALHIAQQLKRPVTVIRGNHEMSNVDLIGGFIGYQNKKVVDNFIHSVYKKHEEIREIWRHGRLVEAVMEGHTLVYDEFTRSHPETNNLFLSVLEEGELPLYGAKQVHSSIPVHPNFRMIFTSNPVEYAGVYKLQDALMDRLITINLSYCDLNTESVIISRKANVSMKTASNIAKLVTQIRTRCLQEGRQGPSLRSSIMIAGIAKQARMSFGDDRFVATCLDILGRYLDDSQSKDVRQYLIDEINQIGTTE